MKGLREADLKKAAAGELPAGELVSTVRGPKSYVEPPVARVLWSAGVLAKVRGVLHS